MGVKLGRLPENQAELTGLPSSNQRQMGIEHKEGLRFTLGNPNK